MNIYLRQHRHTALPVEWRISLSLSHRTVWEAFFLYTLWRNNTRCGLVFQLPHGGNQRLRFREGIREQNYHIKMFGQEEKRHRCDKCVRDYPPETEGDRMFLFSLLAAHHSYCNSLSDSFCCCL